MADTNKSPKVAAGRKSSSAAWTDEERAAMRERAKEVKAASRRSKPGKADGERDLLDKVAEMDEADRSIAERLHALIKENAPGLTPRTWYGMPAYANDEGKVVCFFTAASKFKDRYASFGFNSAANLDEGNMWPTSFALKKLTSAEEARIIELVKRAAS